MSEDIKTLEPFFKAKSVAIIGASGIQGSIGNVLLQNFLNPAYKGKVYPVNPKYNSISGLKCYPSILEIEDHIDLAVIAVPARLTPKIMQECVKKGIKAAIIISGGFSEIGPEGKALEDETIKIAKEGGIRVIGPNCIGVLDTETHIDTFFLPSWRCDRPRTGNISFISQSGAYAAAISDWSAMLELGISKIISLGNKADVNDEDIIRYLSKEDPNTKVICLYIEGFDPGAGRDFIKVAKEVGHETPILVIKSGRTSRGAAAVSSHTGSLAGSDKVFDGAMKQAGVIRAESFEDMFDMAKALAMQPPAKGNRILIVSNGGGVAVMSTDACESLGLDVPELSEEIQNELKKYYPAACATHNPIDVIGDTDAKRYEIAFKIAAASDEVDGVIVGLLLQTPALGMDVTNIIATYAKQINKPVVVVALGGRFTTQGAKILEMMGVPVYQTPERAAKAMYALVKQGEKIYSKEK